MDSKDKFGRCAEFYNKYNRRMWKKLPGRNKMFEEVCAYLDWDNDDNWQSGARSVFGLENKPFFFSFGAAQVKHHDKLYWEFRGVLYDLWRECGERVAVLSDGRSVSFRDYFVECFGKRFGYNVSDARVRARVITCFDAWGINQLVGTADEFRCWKALENYFGKSSVRRAKQWEEKYDVDFYVDDVPLSCKCRGAWNNKTFEKYRYKKNLSKPFAYVNADLDVVFADDAKRSFYRSTVSVLARRIADYNNPRGLDAQFGLYEF